MNVGQSILRYWLMPCISERATFGYVLVGRKGNGLIFPYLNTEIGSLSVVLSGNANELGDTEYSPSQRSLFWLRNGLPGSGLAGDRDVVSVKRLGF